MSTPVWQPGTIYAPGDLVQPASAVAPYPVVIPNAGFESGNTAWALAGPWSIINGGPAFEGTWSAQFGTGFSGNAEIKMATGVAVSPGTTITGSCKFNQGASSSGNLSGQLALEWYTAGDVFISESTGAVIISGSNGEWKQATVTASAPANAGLVRLSFNCNRTGDNSAAWVDGFQWDHKTTQLPAGLIFKAVQPQPGYSGTAEPAWPATNGLQVVDHQVIWEAVFASRVTWQAKPIAVSSAVQPTWPTEPGTFIIDGTVQWECVTRAITDPKNPRTKVVAIIGSKVYAVDEDITPFCATANPRDWSTEHDAGYLPTGLQQANANNMAVLAPYRGNLAALNANCFQNWQVDPDPRAMALLDQMDGIGSTWPKAAVPTANDLLYLAHLGVRSIGIAAGAHNLQAGDIGMPIDALVRPAITTALGNATKVLATYYPSAGQYWLAFSEYPPPALALSGDLPNGVVGGTP